MPKHFSQTSDSNKSSWLLQSGPRATRQVTLSGCPSSPFPPSQGFLLEKSEALRAGGSSPSPSAMVLIGSLNLKNRLNGEQGFLWGEKIEGPRFCAGVPWVLKAGRDGLRSPSSLFSPACWESPRSWSTSLLLRLGDSLSPILAPFALLAAGRNVGRIRRAQWESAFQATESRVRSRNHKDKVAKMQRNCSPAPGRQRALLQGEEHLALGVPKLSGKGEGRETKLSSVSRSRNQG